MESIPFHITPGMTTAWLLLFIVFMAVEVAAAGTLISIWFCGGAIAAAAMSAMGFGWWPQSVVFVLTSAVMMALLRPAAVKYLNKGFQPTNADRIIGQRAIVTEEINSCEGTGAVRADGKIWTAINLAEGERLPVGTEVTIKEIKGVRVFIKKVGGDI